MKLVYAHRNFTHIGLMRSLLERERIPVMVRNEHLSSLMGELPALDIELWVADEDVLLAQSLISEFVQAPEIQHEDWICPRCGVQNEGNMGVCWNCDWEIDGPGSQ